MDRIRKNGATSNIFRVMLRSSATGQGLTGLTSASSGLIISTICDNEAAATAYTVAGSTIETISTLGTFAAPTATKCRFKEVDATNHPGLYEIQLADARYAVSSAKFLVVAISGATNLLAKEIRFQLDTFDLDSANPDVNAKQHGGTAQTGRDIGASVLLSAGTGTGQLDFTSGVVKSSLVQILGTALTETAGQIAAAFKKFFNIPTPAATMDHGVLVDTATTLTNAPSDSTGTTTLLGLLTLARAGYLDNLNVGGAVSSASLVISLTTAISAVINNLNNLSALCNLFGPEVMEIPDSSSTAFPFTVVVHTLEGQLVDLDDLPTITAANAAGTDRSANLSAVTHASTGRYTFTYSVASNAAEEAVRFTVSGAVAADPRYAERIATVVNYDSVTLLNTIASQTTAASVRGAVGLSAANLDSRLDTIEIKENTIIAAGIAIQGVTDQLTFGGNNGMLQADLTLVNDDVDAATGFFGLVQSLQSTSAVSSATSTIVTTALTTANGASQYQAGTTVYVTTGTGQGLSMPLLSHNLSTGALTFAAAWPVTLDNTSIVQMMPVYLSVSQSGDAYADTEKQLLMTTGTGASRKFTVTALSNAPGGSGSIDPTAVVDGVVAALTGQEISINSVVDITDGDRLNLVRGDDHTEGTALPTWTITGYDGPSMDGGTCVVRLLRSAKWTRVDDDDTRDLQVTGTIAQVSTTVTITAPITATQSAALLSTAVSGEDTHEYQIIGTTSGGKSHSLKFGPVTVLRSIVASS